MWLKCFVFCEYRHDLQVKARGKVWFNTLNGSNNIMEEVTSVATSLLHHDSITSCCFTSLLRIFWSYMYKEVSVAGNGLQI